MNTATKIQTLDELLGDTTNTKKITNTKTMSNKVTPVRIILTPETVAYCMTLAYGRDASKNQVGDPMTRCKTKIDKTKTSFGTNVEGIIGEVAARQHYGGKIDTSIRPEGDGHAPDLILADGRGVEIKATPYNKRYEPKINLYPHEVEFADHFCLVAVQLPDIVYVYPIIDRQELESKMKDHDYGYGNRKVYSYN